MDKVKILIEKYGLPEDIAIITDGWLRETELVEKTKKEPFPSHEFINSKKYSILKIFGSDKDRNDKLEKIANSRPVEREVILDNEAGHKAIVLDPQIIKISFKIGKETIKIEDPLIIEYIRECLCKNNIPFERKQSNRPKDETIDWLKGAVESLIIRSPKHFSKKEKINWIADILTLYNVRHPDTNMKEFVTNLLYPRVVKTSQKTQ